jgi:choline kinase
MVLSTIFNNVSAISWPSVLLVEETAVRGREIKISKYITVHGDTVYNYNFIQKINEQKYYNQISPTKTNYVSYNDVTTLFIENMVTIIYCTILVSKECVIRQS